MRSALLCLAFLLSPFAPDAGNAQGQPAVVTGRVAVLDSLAASAGVLVRVEAVNAGTVTDSTGHYRLIVPAQRIGADSVVLSVARIGIRPALRRVLLTPGTEMRMDFVLKVSRPGELPECGHLVHTGSRHRHESVKLCGMSRAMRRKAPERVGPIRPLAPPGE
jgi:hypothetical protein